MNREIKSKMQSCYSVQGQDQTLALGGTAVSGVTNFSLQATPQKSVMLGVPNIIASQDGMVSDIKVAGQSVFCSDGNTPLKMFSADAYAVKERYAGIALGAGLDVFLEGTLDASGDASLAWMVDPVEKGLNMSDQSEYYNYCFGLGTQSIAALNVGTLQQVSTRPCTLGELIAYEATGNDADCFVTSVKIGGVELLTGNGNQEIPLSAFAADNPNVSGLDLNFRIGSNVPVALRVINKHATLAREVRAGVYCRIG